MGDYDGKMRKNGVSRRSFLKTGLGAAAAIGFPTIVPATVFGQFAPSKRINIGCIGAGRISRGHDMALLLPYDRAQDHGSTAIWMRIVSRTARS